jgi:hypothetical protein
VASLTFRNLTFCSLQGAPKTWGAHTDFNVKIDFRLHAKTYVLVDRSQRFVEPCCFYLRVRKIR